jgi:phosphatidate cytidylyltransferase
MLRTRLWMGAILVLLAAGVLIVDQTWEPYYPFLLVFLLTLTTAACVELLNLLPVQGRPRTWFCLGSVVIVLLANWPVHLLSDISALHPGSSVAIKPDPWWSILATFTGVVLGAFLLEMATYQGPGGSVARMNATVWIVAYLGLLPSFLVQQRWLPPLEGDGHLRGVAALALTIFVPKCCDIGAYFTGRFLGRHRMAPVLSPKKTWEGLAGGLTAAMLVTVALNHYLPALRGGSVAAVGFGLTVGLAGVLGDLAESLIKRDCGHKDASQVVPGFGGVLDVVDSVLFAAPVAYAWLLF